MKKEVKKHNSEIFLKLCRCKMSLAASLYLNEKKI